MDRVGVGEHGGAHGVAGLVVGGELLLVVGQRHRLAALAHEHAVAGVLEVRACGSRRRRARTANSAASLTRLERSAPLMPGVPRATTSRSTSGAMRLRLQCTSRIGEALVELGQRHDDLAVEAAGAQQRGVEDVGPVGGRHHHDALGGLEAVHLGEHLVERLLALVVAAAEAGAALAADGVDLVDEDDRPAELAGRLEQVADAAGADADEHLHEVGAGDRQERHAGLAGDGPGDERLAGARRADEQHALGDAGADLGELARGTSGSRRPRVISCFTPS